ncbi:unnamed protein product [Notodromas monacha]|uniref:Xylose isomerase n=1 Tax=Notodromas monacha TaxID=399045 RepID=A0A7R9BKI5_9CRUS|nr:unnamed protein product [Notodromas monacha]CAG0917167.1 unnamed protein product [Notodromas monacha]
MIRVCLCVCADIPKIEYKPEANLEDALCFRHYDASKIVLGKSMEEWLRFSVVYWHTFRGVGSDPFGPGTISRPWDDGTESLDNAKRRLNVAFQFFQKLGKTLKYYAFHDRDIAPEGKTLEETNANLDTVTDLALELQGKTGVKLLWATLKYYAFHDRDIAPEGKTLEETNANLDTVTDLALELQGKTGVKYMNGAATSPDVHVFAQAGAQVKKGLEIAKKLGAENFVFWGGREGYFSLLNTDLKKELDHYAAFLQMAVEYKKKIGFSGQLLIEPKPKEPTKHQYDYDALTVIAFLHTYGLEKDFKLNIEPNHTTLAGHGYEHDIVLSSKCVFSPLLHKHTVFNFLKTKQTFVFQERYSSFNQSLGEKIATGKCTLEECEAFIQENGVPTNTASGRQEKWENLLNCYL